MLPYDLYIEGKHSECKHCVNRKTNPIWGHVLCSEHRVCTEQTFWNPKCCPTCLGQRHQMTFNSQVATINSFKELRVMLRGTRWKLSIQFPDQPWEYEPQIDEFLSDLLALIMLQLIGGITQTNLSQSVQSHIGNLTTTFIQQSPTL